MTSGSTRTKEQMSMVEANEQHELRATARSFFEKYSDESAVRSTMETPEGFDRILWDAMASQLGLQALLIPDEFGGSNFSFSDMQVVMEEMGRALVCSPFLSTAVLAVTALLSSGDRRSCSEWLPRIADGTAVAAIAFTDRYGRWVPDDDEVIAGEDNGRWTVSGTRLYVLDGAAADLVLVAARTSSGPSLFAVDAKAAGFEVTAVETLDMTRRQATLTFDSTAATLVGDAGAADAYLQQALNSALAALAAEQVGGARKIMEMSVDYAKVREQFGRPIGSFQAIKHKCADMLVEVESATSAAYGAGAAIDERSQEAAVLASLAKAYCSEAYCHVAAETIQVHGGIGFTWEHPAHLYFRRAKGSEMLFGAPVYHRERMLKELGL
jgi:alkylation response protein AidB-like acyl-CoA dehydrogenase